MKYVNSGVYIVLGKGGSISVYYLAEHVLRNMNHSKKRRYLQILVETAKIFIWRVYLFRSEKCVSKLDKTLFLYLFESSFKEPILQ